MADKSRRAFLGAIVASPLVAARAGVPSRDEPKDQQQVLIRFTVIDWFSKEPYVRTCSAVYSKKTWPCEHGLWMPGCGGWFGVSDNDYQPDLEIVDWIGFSE